MKKIILALFLCICLLPMTVFADAASDLHAALSEASERINMTYTISAMPNGELSEEAKQYLPWGLVGTTVTFDLEYDGTKKDNLKAKVSLSVTESDGSVGSNVVWVDWHPTVPELLYIVQENDLYYYHDLSADNEVDAEMMKSFQFEEFYNAASVTGMLQKWAKSLKFTYKNGAYRAVLPEKEGEAATEAMFSDLAALFSYALTGSSEDFAVETMRGNVAGIFAMLEGVKLLDEKEAVTAEVTLKNKKTEAMTFSAHVDTDLAKVFSAFGEEMSEKALPVSGTLSLSASYEPVKGDIEFPELTKENFVDAMASVTLPQESAKNKIQAGLNIVLDDVVLAGKNQPYIENDRSMASGQMICAAMGVPYSYDGNKLVIGNDKLIFTKDSATCLVDGAAVAMDAFARDVDSELFVPVRLLAETLGYQVNFTQKRAADGSVFASIVLIDEKIAEIPAISVVVPESQTTTAQVLDVAATLSGMELNLMPVADDIIIEKSKLMLAAGEAVVILGPGEGLGQFNDYVGIVHVLDSYLENLAPKTKALIEGSLEISEVVKNKNGQIMSFPVKNGDKVEYYYVSGTVRNVEGAVSFLNTYSEVLAALLG